MKIPAIRSKIGNQVYYVTTLTFGQIAEYVSAVDDQLHTSKTLSELIQRSITSNFKSIKNYLLNQDEIFFNSLVLAVYDSYPEWQEIEVKFDDVETYRIGLLNFPGPHKIFPVDGQHRVEGIKAALVENKELEKNEVSVIFIGHDNSNKIKTRRIFTTLNRYAKPVSERDKIALDEDDTVAIITRNLVQDFPLFMGNRIVDTKGKAIPNNNKEAITSIVTLYQCNIIIAKYLYQKNEGKSPTKTNFNESFLKFRPEIEVINKYQKSIYKFWGLFVESIPAIKSYLDNEEASTSEFRDKVNGGNLLFRPVGLLPFIAAVFELRLSYNLTISEILKRFKSIELGINNSPWKGIVWNDLGKKMIMNNQVLTKYILKYLLDKSYLTEKENEKMLEGYASKLNITVDEAEKLLNLK